MALFKIATVLAAVMLCVVSGGVVVNEGKDDKASQPYEFEYAVATAADPHHGGSGQQGHAEARVGDHSIGNYFVQLPDQGAATKVSYTTDLWGFHPVVSYSSKGSSTRFAYGDRAVAQLNKPDFPGNLPVSINSAAKVGQHDVDDTLHNIAAAGNPPIPARISHELDKAQHEIAVAQGVPPAPGKGAIVAGPVAPVAPLRYAAQVAPVNYAAPLNYAAPVKYAAPAAPLHYPAPITSVNYAAQVAPVGYAANLAPARYAAPVAPLRYAAPAPVVATAAPYLQAQPVFQTALPLARPTPIAHAAVVQPQIIPRPFNIYEQQRHVKPIVVAEFNSNNHALSHHAPVTAAPAFVSTTPAPFVSYASPTPAPVFVSSTPRPLIHNAGGFIGSTVGPTAFSVTPAAYSVTPAPVKFVSPTPQPIVAELTHHAQPIVVDRHVPYEVTKVVEKPVHVPVEVTKFVDRPVEVTKYVDRPVEVTKFVDRPVQVTKFVDRPVEVTKYVDRPVQVTKFVDRPVEVTKYVDRPVEVTKYVDRPVPVTKYVDRPFEVIKHVPVEKPVYVPGPTVEKHVPVPYTKVVHVDRPVPQPVAVPYAVPQPVAVPHPVPQPVPVPYAQYVLNVPYEGRFAYGKGRAGPYRDGSYADAALKFDAWKAERSGCGKCAAALSSELFLKQGGNAGSFEGGRYGYGGPYRTENANIKGFRVSKTYLADSDIVPNPGPTKVTLTVEPHVHKTELGRKLCEEAFKPPLIPSPLISEGIESW